MIFSAYSVSSFDNLELANLVVQVRQLSNDSKKNGAAIARLLKRIVPLAKAERNPLFYIDALKELLFFQNRYEDSYAALYYAELFFRACAQYLAVNPFPDKAALHKLSFAYHNVFSICHRFAQIDDTKMERFWESFRAICEKSNLSVLYWMSQTDLALIYQDQETAVSAARQLEKQPYDTLYCYACRKQSVMGAYILQNDLESCKALAQQILNREIPAEHLRLYVDCKMKKITGLYADLVEFSVWSANRAALDYFLPPFVEACHAEGITENTVLCYCHAAMGDFSHLAEDLAYMATTEMDESAAQRARWSAWNTIFTSLVWVSYLKKLLQYGTDKIALPSLPEDLSFPIKDGQYLVQPLLAWWEARADDAGHVFEASRAKFHYAPLKENYLRLCGVS